MVKSIKNLEQLHAKKNFIPEDAYEGLEWIGNGFEVEEVLSELYPEQDTIDINTDDLASALQTDASKKGFVIVDGEEELEVIIQNFYKDEWVKVVQAQEVYDKVVYCKAS